jgi:ABC-type uncharacterized transport system substrate-binding protein
LSEAAAVHHAARRHGGDVALRGARAAGRKAGNGWGDGLWYAGRYEPFDRRFVQRLHELGWIEGRNVAIEYRWGEGRTERFTEIADEFVRLKVDLILTHNTPPTLAAKQATSVIPIVFATAGDPVGTGIVARLSRPGGNITGLSGQSADMAGKRIEMLREIVPGLRRLAILAEVGNPLIPREIDEVHAAAHTLALETDVFEIRQAEEIGPAVIVSFLSFKKFDARYFGTFATVSGVKRKESALAPKACS